MGKQRKKSVQPAVRHVPANVVLAGAACLALGLGIGYFFGRQSVVTTSMVSPAQTQAPPSNPARFLQDEAALKSMAAANPKDPNALAQLGNLYYDNGKFEQAIEWYGKALEVSPNNVSVRTDLGTSYWNLGQADAAIAEFRKSLAVDPTHPQTLYNMGVVYLHGKNDPEEARKAWETLLAANPAYPESARIKEMIASLQDLPAGAASATPPAAGGPDKVGGVKDLLEKMKSRP